MIISYILYKTKQFINNLKTKIRQDYVNYLFRHFKSKEDRVKPNPFFARKKQEKLLAATRLGQIAELEKSNTLTEHLLKRKEILTQKYSIK